LGNDPNIAVSRLSPRNLVDAVVVDSATGQRHSEKGMRATVEPLLAAIADSAAIWRMTQLL